VGQKTALAGAFSAVTVILFGQAGPFGLSLSPSTQALLDQVEASYKHPVVQIVGQSGALLGSSSVTDDGWPAVELSPNSKNEATFAHELMHLALRAEGYPMVIHKLPGGGEPVGALALDLNRNLLLIRDPIEHWIFAPRMKKMGVNPNQDSIERMQAFVKDGDFKGISPPLRLYMQTAYYFQAVLILVDDPDLLRQIRARYVRNGWQKQSDLGQTMADVVLTSKPSSPEEEVASYVAVSNLILRKVHLSVSKWSERRLGTFSEKIAVIDLAFSER
jgi:hypothetical protein